MLTIDRMSPKRNFALIQLPKKLEAAVSVTRDCLKYQVVAEE